jgi:lysophospholipase L1-like esterase
VLRAPPARQFVSRFLLPSNVQAGPPISTLADNFNDNVRDVALWTIGSFSGASGLVTVAETSAQLQITPPSSTGGVNYSGYTSLLTYDFTNGNVVVEAVQTTGNNTADTEAFIGVDANNNIVIVKESTSLLFQKKIAGGAYTNIVSAITYDSVAHRWWRFRHETSDDTIRLDTSPDNVVWTQRASTPRPWLITNTRVVLDSGTYQSVATPGTAIFDNLTGAANALPYDVTAANWFFSPGNWIKNGTTYAQTNTPGAYMRANFTGTGLSLGVDVTPLSSIGAAAAQYPIVGWQIDGGAWASAQLTNGQTSLSMVSGLPDGGHTACIAFKGTGSTTDRWNTPSAVLRVTSLSATFGVLASPTLASSRWLFFGDSITEGINVTGTSYAASVQNATRAWGVQLAASEIAEVGIIGFVSQGWAQLGDGNIPVFHDAAGNQTWDKHWAGQARSFTGIDTIVVNVGANDTLGGVPSSDSDVQTRTQDFLTVFTTANPAIAVYLVLPFGGFKATPITAAYTAFKAANPSNTTVRLIDLNLAAGDPTLFEALDGDGVFATYSLDGIHPNQAGHDRLAALLYAALPGSGSIVLTAHVLTTLYRR